MAVVKDRESSYKKSEEFSAKLFNFISKELKTIADQEDGVAESVYFLTHVAAQVKTRVCLSCAAFGKNFNIDVLNVKVISEIIDSIADGILHNNLSVIDDVINLLNKKDK